MARAYPIAIDAKGLNQLAGHPEAAERAAEIRSDLGDPRTIFLGVDRLDYTKGLLERIRAFGELIDRGQDRRRTTPSWSSWPSRRGSGSTSTASCATTSTGWWAGSTATSDGSVGRRSTTCTPPIRGRRWRRCTARPTSWWSPRCATG